MPNAHCTPKDEPDIWMGPSFDICDAHQSDEDQHLDPVGASIEIETHLGSDKFS